MKWKVPFAGTEIYWSAEPQGMLIVLFLQNLKFKSPDSTIFKKISLIVKKKFKKFWPRKKSGRFQAKMIIYQKKIRNGRNDSSRSRMLDTFCGEIQNQIKNGKCVIPKVSVTDHCQNETKITFLKIFHWSGFTMVTETPYLPHQKEATMKMMPKKKLVLNLRMKSDSKNSNKRKI